MDSIKITLETLYDVLLNEKKKEDLQKLDSSFFIDVVSYLREKKMLLEGKESSDNIFASGEKDKLEYELRSIKRILKEIYEKREKKIIEIALNRSRTGSDIIDTSCMLKEEKEFYEETLTNLNKYRVGILSCLFKGKLPDIEGNRQQIVDSLDTSKPEKTFSDYVENHDDEEDSDETDFGVAVTPKVEPEVKLEVPDVPKVINETSDDILKKKLEVVPKIKQEATKIKFINPMPSFVWKDMKVYGPYDKGEEIDIFPEVADLLVRKGRAEKV